MQAHAPMTHGQLKLRMHARVIFGPWGHLGVSDLEGGVYDGVGCYAHSAFHRPPARDSGQVGHSVLYGTLKNRKLALGGQGQGQEFLYSTLGLLSFGLHVRPHKVLGFPGGCWRRLARAWHVPRLQRSALIGPSRGCKSNRCISRC